ncbi:MAG TPA: FimV/HubP family polar landmark protein [Casimicrobiaceae bacterium]|nr:FimV/HubP family polar landmark protein [Casimicrobiaceae bacterium]
MRAKPVFKLTLLATALMASGAVQALGLGRLTVESALGQPLSARIDLTSASRDELDTLSARISDPALYRQNNMTFQPALARTRVTVEQGPNGPYLRVTSPSAVNEPYLDLIVEANWASGRIVRSYTFLLDPPGVQVQAPVEPVTPVRGAATSPAPRPAPVASTAAPAAPAVAAGAGYAVKRGDTLSKIAADTKPATVTLDQMLVALFKSNAGAFDGNNMNRLRTGAIITVPSADEAASTPAPEATRVVQVQAADWRAYRDRIAAAAPTSQGAAGRSASGQIGAAVSEAAPAARPGGDQLRVSRDAGGGRGASAASEDAVAQAQQLREAQSRIAMLERTIADMQQAMQLRSPAMAQAQAQAEAASGKAAPAPAAKGTEPRPAPIAAAPKVEPAKVEPAKVEPAKAEPAKAEPAKAEPAKVEPPKAVAPKAETPTPAEPPKAAEAPKAEPPKADAASEPPKVVRKGAPKIAEPPKEAPGFFEDLFANTPTWAIGGGALAILAGIAAIVAMRRRKTTKFEDSIISGTDIKTNTVFGSTGGGVVNTGDNSLGSDFSREGLGNIDTDEVDPIAEAEVYLAYGRDAQAEEILKDALKKDPQRQEIYLKLLEIHAQHNKPSAFETVASELYAVSQGQGEVWHKAVGLGRQLDPSNPMFAEGGTPASRPARVESDTFAVGGDYKPAAPKEDKEFDIGLDEEISLTPTSGAAPKPEPRFEAFTGEETVIHKHAEPAHAQGAGAGTVAGIVAAGAAMAATAGAAMHGLGAKAESAQESIAEKVKAAADKFDLDFHLDDADKPAPLKPKPEPALTAATAAVSGTADKLARPAAALELDKLDLHFDPDKATFEDPTPSVLDGQWHDAATKLDLAKAYQEMGDVEGAREILQEVLHEGDDEQKKEAQAILGKLG